MSEEPDPEARVPRRIPGSIIVSGTLMLFLAAGAAAGFYLLESDFFPRVPAGSVAVLVRRSGRTLPAGVLVAPKTAPGEEPYQGVQQDVLTPGWYPGRLNRWSWDWVIVPEVNIPAEHVGVLIRMVGEDLADGRVFADEDPEDERRGILRKGPLLRTLEPGTHAVNLWMYRVRIFEQRSIAAGSVGVVCRRYGPLPKDRAAFLSAPGERGIQPAWLPAGSYFINPIAEEVRAISCQSRRLDLGASGRVKFPSSDGFDITVNGTIEWSLDPDLAASAFAKYGDARAVEERLLLPAARTKARLQGSRKAARELIAGSTRQTFQEEFAKGLESMVAPEGVRLQSVLMSGIVTPEEIARPVRERESAVLLRAWYREQMKTAVTQAELTRLTELEKRPQALAAAQIKSIEATGAAQREQSVQSLQAGAAVEVAKLELETAQRRAAAVRTAGDAEGEAARRKAGAAADGLRRVVEAHGGGEAYARAVLLEKVASKIKSIHADPDGPLGGVFGILAADPQGAVRP